MRVIYYCLASLLLVAKASATCDACINNVCYTRNKLFESAQISGQLAVDRTSNELHFHFKDLRSKDYTGILNLNYVNARVELLTLSDSFARAVDQATGAVYMSGDQGVYVYNSNSKQTRLLGLENASIWHMQFKDKLYYTEYMQPGLFYLDNDRSVAIPALVNYVIDDFIVDKLDDIYFASDYIVYRLKKNDVNATVFSPVLYSLTTDKYDNVYFIETGIRSLYALNYLNDELKEIGLFGSGNIVRVVFDNNNNIIYSDVSEDRIYHLSPNYGICETKWTDTSNRRKGLRMKLFS